MIEAFIRFMNSSDELTGPFNIGNPCEFSIKELSEKIIGLTNSRSGLVFKPLPEDDPVQRQPDIALAKNKLDWEPKVHLEDGLKKTIACFDNLIKH